MNIEILDATERDFPVIENLIAFYIYDLSEYMGWKCPESGRFGGQDNLSQYWGKMPDDPQYAWPEGTRGYPFVVRVDKQLAGFALVKQIGHGSPSSYEMGGFFILRKYRRQGVGKHVARHLFDTFPGDWTIGEMRGNTPAIAFWTSAISEYTGGKYRNSQGRDHSHGFEMVYQHFNNESHG